MLLISNDVLATINKYTSAAVVEIRISRFQSRLNHHVVWLASLSPATVWPVATTTTKVAM